MSAIIRFVWRAASSCRHPILFTQTHPKKTEALGLLILLSAAFSQVQSDNYQRILMNQRLVSIEDEVQFTRQQVMGLIACQPKGNCTDWDREQTMPETSFFMPPNTRTNLIFWQYVRYMAFFVGSCLIIISKWLDGKPLKVIVAHGESRFSKRYRALLSRLRQRLVHNS